MLIIVQYFITKLMSTETEIANPIPTYILLTKPIINHFLFIRKINILCLRNIQSYLNMDIQSYYYVFLMYHFLFFLKMLFRSMNIGICALFETMTDQNIDR